MYSFRRCPYAMRARLGILFAEWKVELREIVLKNKPAQMLAISLKARFLFWNWLKGIAPGDSFSRKAGKYWNGRCSRMIRTVC
ncbi:hypothetical protein AU14_03815 [Marinobacter similis]|uniref:GST N-terminal domain-containing protein n=1 Tax=Marinobacter similis TaxID=1420916 RepID=W5YM77_9GAMM|nr:hypothetical protein AU14_03815 [Marinobacter similis]